MDERINLLAELAQARRERDEARRVAQRLAERVKRLILILRRVRQVCLGLIARARDEALDKKSGVPRGIYAFWRGIHDGAAEVLRELTE